jgi:GT2 family glycosyltransferase
MARQVRAIRESELFDAAWYRARVRETGEALADPAEHYCRIGAFQGLDPGPRFSSAGYWEANPDVALAGLNPLAHYLLHGRAERRPVAPGAPSGRLPPPGILARWRQSARLALRPLLRPRLLLRPGAPEGFGDTAPLRTEAGRQPTGWVLVQPVARRGMPGADRLPLSLRVLDETSVREVGLPPAGHPQDTLVRLPDRPAPLGLGCGLRSGDAVAAVLPEHIAVREIGRAEAVLRLAWQAGWRAMLRGARTQGPRCWLQSRAADRVPSVSSGYPLWVSLYDTPSRAEVAAMRARATAMRQPPRFSVVVPVYDTPRVPLMEMLASVRRQIYPHWELCLADDASPSADVRDILRAAAAEDARIRLDLRARNGNIVAASNSALALARGDFVALLDHDDMLAPHALLTMAETIQANPGADLLYSDEDKLDPQGQRYGPYFKPDYNTELMQGQNLVSHLGVYRARVVRELGGFREGFDGSQDYDLALRVAARTQAPIVHVPHILYHWRVWEGADTFSSTQIERAVAAARRAIREQAAARGDSVQVVDGPAFFHRVVRQVSDWPPVTAIVPTRDHADVLRECMDGLFERTDYPALDILVVDNDSAEPDALAYLQELAGRGVRVMRHPGRFNYSAMNNRAVRAAAGRFVLLLNNDISMRDLGWLREMVARALVADVGAVGARLLYPDGTVQHGGVVLGMGGVAGHMHLGAARDDPGYFGQLMLAREVSAATGACLLVRRSAFLAVGGLDEENLPVAFNDVDLCLRLRAAGLRVVWTPHAELVHHESKSRGSDFTPERLAAFQAEVAYMERRWADALPGDPFFNVNLALDKTAPTIAYPPRGPSPFMPEASRAETMPTDFAAPKRAETVH